jgi:ABC-2 type transport system permease protein
MSINFAADSAPAASLAPGQNHPRLGLRAYFACFSGIVWREVLRYVHQRERFFLLLVFA